MKHIRKVTVVREDVLRSAARPVPDFADAKTDFQNAVWRAWEDYLMAKKNELTLA